jgi:hypothetical protein
MLLFVQETLEKLNPLLLDIIQYILLLDIMNILILS